jgi:hypothetical protein
MRTVRVPGWASFVVMDGNRILFYASTINTARSYSSYHGGTIHKWPLVDGGVS